MRATRRRFLIGAGIGIGGFAASKIINSCRDPQPIPGCIVGSNAALGHRIRSGSFPEPVRILEKEVVIVGAGIAGLGAGYRLHKGGQRNFVLLDLEKQSGGTSVCGRNDVCSYPWGAHYVPLLTEEATAVRKLFEELGVITGYNAQGHPTYDEYFLCGEPQERLYRFGRWQEGLVPALGINEEENREFSRFFSFMEDLKNQKGRDGKRLFAIPIEKSSQETEWLALDKLTMAEWLDREGYRSTHLRWYVDYSCRDDFGTGYKDTSAWAGLHYFAARNGVAANAHSADVLTWPEGNGWLAEKLAQPINENIITSALVYRVRDNIDSVIVDYWDEQAQNSIRIHARAAVMATPRFVTSRLLQSARAVESAEEFSYSPWVVANITLSILPRGKGAALSWDNVVFDSPLLGYVVATHQMTEMHPLKTVLTYYWPLSHLSPAEARKEALSRTYSDWQNIFLGELFKIHPELEGHIEQLDVWVWGHAMVRPTRGFIWGDARMRSLEQHPPIFFAHSDMSGIPIFEEAYTHGVRAAEGVLDHFGFSYRSEL